MRALVGSSLLVLAVLSGCADPPPATAPHAKPAEKSATAPKVDDGFAELTPQDCQAWADHFRARLKEATARRIDECRASLGGETTLSDQKDRSEADAEADRLHGLIIDQCGQQVGAAYVKKDAQCYLAAKRLEDWKSCPFQSMFFADYKAVAKNHEKLFSDRCAREAKAPTATAPKSEAKPTP